MKKVFAGFGVLLSLILALVQPAAAATHNVAVTDSGFAPATLTITAGDTVVWENQDEFFPHSIMSNLGLTDPDYWTCLLVEQGDQFAHTFDNVGTFAYHDLWDAGSIIVQAAVVVPSNINLESGGLAGGQFWFTATSLTAGKTNVLEISTDLTSWTAVQTNVASEVAMTFTNGTKLLVGFFRLVELP